MPNNIAERAAGIWWIDYTLARVIFALLMLIWRRVVVPVLRFVATWTLRLVLLGVFLNFCYVLYSSLPGFDSTSMCKLTPNPSMCMTAVLRTNDIVSLIWNFICAVARFVGVTTFYEALILPSLLDRATRCYDQYYSYNALVHFQTYWPTFVTWIPSSFLMGWIAVPVLPDSSCALIRMTPYWIEPPTGWRAFVGLTWGYAAWFALFGIISASLVGVCWFAVWRFFTRGHRCVTTYGTSLYSTAQLRNLLKEPTLDETCENGWQTYDRLNEISLARVIELISRDHEKMRIVCGRFVPSFLKTFSLKDRLHICFPDGMDDTYTGESCVNPAECQRDRTMPNIYYRSVHLIPKEEFAAACLHPTFVVDVDVGKDPCFHFGDNEDTAIKFRVSGSDLVLSANGQEGNPRKFYRYSDNGILVAGDHAAAYGLLGHIGFVGTWFFQATAGTFYQDSLMNLRHSEEIERYVFKDCVAERDYKNNTFVVTHPGGTLIVPSHVISVTATQMCASARDEKFTTTFRSLFQSKLTALGDKKVLACIDILLPLARRMCDELSLSQEQETRTIVGNPSTYSYRDRAINRLRLNWAKMPGVHTVTSWLMRQGIAKKIAPWTFKTQSIPTYNIHVKHQVVTLQDCLNNRFFRNAGPATHTGPDNSIECGPGQHTGECGSIDGTESSRRSSIASSSTDIALPAPCDDTGSDAGSERVRVDSTEFYNNLVHESLVVYAQHGKEEQADDRPTAAVDAGLQIADLFGTSEQDISGCEGACARPDENEEGTCTGTGTSRTPVYKGNQSNTNKLLTSTTGNLTLPDFIVKSQANTHGVDLDVELYGNDEPIKHTAFIDVERTTPSFDLVVAKYLDVHVDRRMGKRGITGALNNLFYALVTRGLAPPISGSPIKEFNSTRAHEIPYVFTDAVAEQCDFPASFRGVGEEIPFEKTGGTPDGWKTTGRKARRSQKRLARKVLPKTRNNN